MSGFVKEELAGMGGLDLGFFPLGCPDLRHDSQLILKHEIENFRVILHAFYMLRITFLENLSRKRMISNYGSRL